MADVIPLSGKRPPGRPRRSEPPVPYTLRFTRQQAAYLTYLANVVGWAPSANAVARLIIESELKRLSAARFFEGKPELPTDIDDSSD